MLCVVVTMELLDVQARTASGREVLRALPDCGSRAEALGQISFLPHDALDSGLGARLQRSAARGLERLLMFISESSIQQPDDADSISSLEDALDSVAIETKQRSAPLTHGRVSLLVTEDADSAHARRAWLKADALGAALVVLRRASGVRDVGIVLLEFLERPIPLVLSLEATRWNDFYFASNLPIGICWSCRRKIDMLSGYEDTSMGLIEDDDIPSNDGDVPVLESALCHPKDRTQDCLAGYEDLVPEIVRLTHLWKENISHRDLINQSMSREADFPEDVDHVDHRFLRDFRNSDFFDIIAARYPQSMQALRAAGWGNGHHRGEWRRCFYAAESALEI